MTPRLTELIVDRKDLAIFSQAFMHSGLQVIEIELPLGGAELDELMDNMNHIARDLENATLFYHALDIDDLDGGLCHFLRHHRKLRITNFHG